jgi:hypothetical protein
VGVAAAFAVAAAPAAQAAPVKVQQLVTYRNGDAKQQLVKAAGTKVALGRRRCAVPANTALAALLDASLPGIKLRDYGSCSKRPADAGGLYVVRIRKDTAKGASGWVYKVGNKVGTTGSADISGPFGSGRLKPRDRVTWFYCHMKTRGCQRTLVARPKALGDGRLEVTVRGYDDGGKAKLIKGATVHAGGQSATTDARGVATMTAEAGQVSVYATAKGLVRSFEERIEVR